MTYYMMGVFFALLITLFMITDLERKRKRIRHIALRLEQITRGKARSRVRHVRRLTLSTFLYEQLIRQVHEQIAAVETDNGIEPAELPSRDLFFFERRLDQMERRVERLAERLEADRPAGH